jgi:hypothetical protein
VVGEARAGKEDVTARFAEHRNGSIKSLAGSVRHENIIGAELEVVGRRRVKIGDSLSRLKKAMDWPIAYHQWNLDGYQEAAM